MPTYGKLLCHCPAYTWPHRRGGGKCIWNPTRIDNFCLECGLPCCAQVVWLEPEEISPHELPLPTETVVSDCCGAPVVLGGEILEPPTT